MDKDKLFMALPIGLLVLLAMWVIETGFGADSRVPERGYAHSY